MGCNTGGPIKMKLAHIDSGQVEAGSKFTLRVPLMFGQQSALYFQDAKLLAAGELNPNMPYCRLTQGSPASPRVIEPATFAVRSVDYDDTASVSTGQGPGVTRIQLAANAQQPYSLACQWPQGGPSKDFPTTQEIEGAIGAHFTMALQR